MFPFFISQAYAADLSPKEYIELIVPLAMQISIAIGILAAAVVGAIYSVKSAFKADQSVKVSQANSIQIKQLEQRVDQASSDVQAKVTETLSSNSGASNQSRQNSA